MRPPPPPRKLPPDEWWWNGSEIEPPPEAKILVMANTWTAITAMNTRVSSSAYCVVRHRFDFCEQGGGRGTQGGRVLVDPSLGVLEHARSSVTVKCDLPAS